MDTKSTNSKAYIFTKVITVLLLVLALGFSAVQVTKSYSTYEENATGYYLLRDAISVKDASNIYPSEAFRRKMESYLCNLGELVYDYGAGTKESFKSIAQENDFETCKERLLYNIYYTTTLDDETYGIEDLLTLHDDGVVSRIHLIKEDTDGYYEDEYVYIGDGGSAAAIVSDYCSTVYYGSSWVFSQEKEAIVSGAEKYDADILIDIPAYDLDYDGHSEYLVAGTYAITVNDERLKALLADANDLMFMDYKQFREAYKEKKADFEDRFRNINYIYKDKNGKLISNIEVPERIYLKDYEYVLAGKCEDMVDTYGIGYSYSFHSDGDIAVNTGEYYGGTFDKYLIGAQVDVTSPTSVTDFAVDNNDVTGTTTYPPENGARNIPVSSLENDSFCIFFNENAEFDGRTVKNIKREAVYANMLVRDLAFYTVVSVLCLSAALVVLLILCGRKRKGDEEVHFPFSDRMFIEIKTVLNGGLIFGIFFLSVNFVEEFASGGMDLVAYLLAGAALPTMSLLLIDYILYIARHLKARKFLSSFLVVWLIKFLCANSFKVLKKLWSVAGKVIKTFFEIIFIPLRKLKEALNSEKLFYAKSVDQTVKIKTAILIAVNVPFALLCFILIFLTDGIDSYAELFFLLLSGVPAMACDALALIRGLSFVGGVSRIAEVISEYRKGNLDEPINRAGLPSYLIPVGENLESLGEGIRLAVDEAVKQEATKTELITNISHDLKTPLTSIINYVDLLKKCDINDETALSYLEVLGDKSDRLKVLITDLVEASKAATGNVDVNITNISLREILTQLAGEFADAFEKKNLDVILSVPDDIIVYADNKLLYRVLENLAINIEKYSMSGTRVYISAERQGTKGVIIFKNISNAPLNITPDELKQRFVRGDESRTTDGNGLGLSIAENLCIVQGGSLDIDIVGDLFVAKIELNRK